jgi:hypothetical protein
MHSEIRLRADRLRSRALLQIQQFMKTSFNDFMNSSGAIIRLRQGDGVFLVRYVSKLSAIFGGLSTTR